MWHEHMMVVATITMAPLDLMTLVEVFPDETVGSAPYSAEDSRLMAFFDMP